MKKLYDDLNSNREFYNRENVLKLNRENLIKNCEEHMPILLAYNPNTMVGVGNNMRHKEYKKCLCCSLDMSFDPNEALFDVSDVWEEYNESLDKLNIKFYTFVEEFSKCVLESSSKEEAISKFNESIQYLRENHEFKRTRKK